MRKLSAGHLISSSAFYTHDDHSHVVALRLTCREREYLVQNGAE
jgi:hypothetical protein